MITERDNFKLTIEHHGRLFSYEAPFDTDVNQAIDAFYGLLISDGYQVRDVHQAFEEFAEELKRRL